LLAGIVDEHADRATRRLGAVDRRWRSGGSVTSNLPWRLRGRLAARISQFILEAFHLAVWRPASTTLPAPRA